MRTRARGIRRGVNYGYFRWRTRDMELSEDALKVFSALDYSRAMIRFAEDAFEDTSGVALPFEASAPALLRGSFDAGDVILDVGAWKGEFAAQMRSLHDCCVHAFEPEPTAVDELRERFADDAKVRVHPIGLAAANTTAALELGGPGSSIYRDSPARAVGWGQRAVRLRDVKEVFDELGLDDVALLKVNIEGGEYDLLDRMIECGLHTRCRYIRVQFHDWYERARRRRRAIVGELGRTHEVEWSYPFVWESWLRRTR